MRVRKMSVLAGAVLAAMPVIGSAATITYSYESFEYTMPGSGTYTNVNPTLVAGVETVNVPVGAVLETGIQESVSGSTVPTAVTTGAYAAAHPGTVPSSLGVALFGFGFTDSSPTVSVWDASNAGPSFQDFPKPVVNGNFLTGVSTGSDDALTSGGIKANSISGGSTSPSTTTVPNVITAAQASTISYGSGSSADLFSGLYFDANTQGSDLYVPLNNATTPGQTANQYFTYVSGGTGTSTKSSNAPTYAAVNISSTDTVNALPSLNIIVGNVVTSPTTHSIISLISSSSTPASGYGNADGTITMTGKGFGSYNVSTAVGFTAATTGGIDVKGFNPTNDTEIYALKLTSNGVAISGTQIATVIADINGGSGNTAAVGVTASAITGVYTNLFPGYEVLLTSTAGITDDAELNFDFSSAGEQDSAVPGLVLTGVAAVPEPATAAGVVLGAAGLLLGRRKNRLVVS